MNYWATEYFEKRAAEQEREKERAKFHPGIAMGLAAPLLLPSLALHPDWIQSTYQPELPQTPESMERGFPAIIGTHGYGIQGLEGTHAPPLHDSTMSDQAVEEARGYLENRGVALHTGGSAEDSYFLRGRFGDRLLQTGPFPGELNPDRAIFLHEATHAQDPGFSRSLEREIPAMTAENVAVMRNWLQQHPHVDAAETFRQIHPSPEPAGDPASRMSEMVKQIRAGHAPIAGDTDADPAWRYQAMLQHGPQIQATDASTRQDLGEIGNWTQNLRGDTELGRRYHDWFNAQNDLEQARQPWYKRIL